MSPPEESQRTSLAREAVSCEDGEEWSELETAKVQQLNGLLLSVACHTRLLFLLIDALYR